MSVRCVMNHFSSLIRTLAFVSSIQIILSGIFRVDIIIVVICSLSIKGQGSFDML